MKMDLKNINMAGWPVLRFFVNSSSVGKLVGKSLLLLVIPYAYLFLCGFLFDYLLKWYFMTTFIFVSMVLLYVIALALIVWAVIRFVREKKV